MISEAEVTAWMGLSNLSPEDASALSLVVPAVNAYVASLPSINIDPFYNDWAETTKLGAVMLAARLFRRKNSPGGIEASGDTISYVSRYDSDIARLLNIDSFRKPMVG